MANSKPTPNYPSDLRECKCGFFKDSGRKAFSAGQKKFYSVCENCGNICDEDFQYQKIQEGIKARSDKMKEIGNGKE